MHRASLSHVNIQNKHLLICNNNYPCHYIKPLSTGIPCNLNSCNVLFMMLMKVNCFFAIIITKQKCLVVIGPKNLQIYTINPLSPFFVQWNAR